MATNVHGSNTGKYLVSIHITFDNKTTILHSAISFKNDIFSTNIYIHITM